MRSRSASLCSRTVGPDASPQIVCSTAAPRGLAPISVPHDRLLTTPSMRPMVRLHPSLLPLRFCNNEMVRGGPGVRFYCGTPLIASNGHRIGTLCFADVKPREFDASRCVVLNNLAELVVRHLEKDIALQLRAHDNNSLAAAYGNLRRTLDCFDHCVALVDTSAAGWRILFVNNPACKMLGERVLFCVCGAHEGFLASGGTACRGVVMLEAPR